MTGFARQRSLATARRGEWLTGVCERGGDFVPPRQGKKTKCAEGFKLGKVRCGSKNAGLYPAQRPVGIDTVNQDKAIALLRFARLQNAIKPAVTGLLMHDFRGSRILQSCRHGLAGFAPQET